MLTFAPKPKMTSLTTSKWQNCVVIQSFTINLMCSLFTFQKFLEGYCKYEGSEIEHNQAKTDDANDCQADCADHYPDCAYFLFDKESLQCSLYQTDRRECDQIRGPKMPEYEICNMNTTEMDYY